MSKEKDVKWINDFMGITLSSVCKEVGVDRDNVRHGKASEEKTAKVKKRIKEKIDELEK